MRSIREEECSVIRVGDAISGQVKLNLGRL